MDELFEKELDSLEAPPTVPRKLDDETFFVDTIMLIFALMVLSLGLAFTSALIDITEHPIWTACMLFGSITLATISGWYAKGISSYKRRESPYMKSLWDRIQVSYEQPKRRSHKVVRKKGVTLYG